MGRAAQVIALGALLAISRPTAADPCCDAGTCEDLLPPDCVAAGGVVGHCRVGEPCGVASCDGSAIGPIDDLRAHRGGDDVVLTWSADPDASLYRTAWDVEPAMVGGCEQAWFPDVGWPSTVAEWVHEGAINGALGIVFFYCVSADCTLSPVTGACCDGTTCDPDLTQAQCAAGGGSWLGAGSDCSANPCAPVPGACCRGECCVPDLLEADCVATGGTFLGAGTDCSASPCTTSPRTGACCDGTTCVDGLLHAECQALGGAWNGVGSSCATTPCSSSVASVTPCLIDENVFYFNGDASDYIHPGTDTVTAGTWSETGSPRLVHIGCDPTDASQGLWWDAYFSSEELGADLAIGVYDNAMRWPFENPGRPGLSVSGDGRGCNRLSGRFEILALTRDCSGRVEAFTATWVQHCEEGAAALRGCVHYER